MEENQEQENQLFIHYYKNKPRQSEEGTWELDVYAELNGEFFDDTLYFTDKEDVDAFTGYFKSPTIEPLLVRLD